MPTNEDRSSTMDDKIPAVRPGNYNPVTVDMKDTLGGIFLGILAWILLVGWTRAEARNRALMKQLELSKSEPCYLPIN